MLKISTIDSRVGQYATPHLGCIQSVCYSLLRVESCQDYAKIGMSCQLLIQVCRSRGSPVIVANNDGLKVPLSGENRAMQTLSRGNGRAEVSKPATVGDLKSECADPILLKNRIHD
jgi:hypothetical protein